MQLIFLTDMALGSLISMVKLYLLDSIQDLSMLYILNLLILSLYTILMM